jgi:hypothetical protein
MSKSRKSWALFILTGFSLIIGFGIEAAWIIGGLIGLIPATSWVIQDLRRKTFGSDFVILATTP